MIMGDQVAEIFKSFVRGSVATIIDSFFNVCKEVLKFLLILLLLYYFALRSFQFIDDILLTIETTEKYDKPKFDLMAHKIVGETYLRIGAPDENLINQRADLLEQLEIEAEFEENLNKFIKSDDGLENSSHMNVPITVPNIRTSDEIASLKDIFISQINRESSETSRPAQTVKTSLGKKSKLRANIEDGPTTTTGAYNDQAEDEKLWQIFNIENVTGINDEIVTEPNVSSIPEEQRPSNDKQYVHESFH